MFGITLLTKEEKAERDKLLKIKGLEDRLAKEMDIRKDSLLKSQELQAELEKLIKG